ncbi:MAG: GNAT family N-acetyltransferase [Nitrososphaerota archaeon]|nr:GNAT family N-acetyltransferase [Nitrososphaerota archaeon]
MEIRVDDLSGGEIKKLVIEHLEDMSRNSSPESCHALSVEQLKSPEVTLWSAWEKGDLLGCGALKQLTSQYAEVKTMRTLEAHRNKGVGGQILKTLVREARKRNYKRLYLETGSGEPWAPARRLYEKFGFKECGPFGDYVEDPESYFMTLEL